MLKLKTNGENLSKIEGGYSLSKRIMSGIMTLLTTFTMAAATLDDASAEDISTLNSIVVEAGLKDPNEAAPATMMTVEDFKETVILAYQTFHGFLPNIDHLDAYITAAVYMANRSHISDEVAEELVRAGYITHTNFHIVQSKKDGDFEIEDPEGFTNLINCQNFVNEANDQYEQRIHTDWLNGTVDISHYPNPSVLFFDPKEREIANIIFTHQVNGYNLTPGTFQFNGDHDEVFESITSLQASENNGDVNEVSSGAAYMFRTIFGRREEQFQEDYMIENYSFEELTTNRFDPVQLASEQFVLSDDVVINRQCVNELDQLTEQWGALYTWCFDDVLDNVTVVVPYDQYEAYVASKEEGKIK